MNNDLKNDLFYFCFMAEYVARKTHNKIKDVILKLSDKDIEHELSVASVNHCLSSLQVSDEWIAKYKINNSDFDNITTCKYNVPSYTSIDKVYQRLILEVSNKDDLVQNIRKVFSSFISEAISNFNSSVYYSNPSYLYYSYLNGELLS